MNFSLFSLCLAWKCGPKWNHRNTKESEGLSFIIFLVKEITVSLWSLLFDSLPRLDFFVLWDRIIKNNHEIGFFCPFAGMIMGASASSIWYSLMVKHSCRNAPIIDYDLVLLFQPMLMMGITTGVTLSVIFPYWLITILIIILFIGKNLVVLGSIEHE